MLKSMILGYIGFSDIVQENKQRHKCLWKTLPLLLPLA